jgi:hypothetical protein
MALKFRRGTTAQQSGSLAFGEPYVNTTLGTLLVGGPTGDIVLSTAGTGSTGNFGPISGSGLDITGNANIAGNLTLGGKLTIGDATSDTVNVVASLSSSLIPQTTKVFDLGSSTKEWDNLYVSNANFSGDVNITGSLVTSGSKVEFNIAWPGSGSEQHIIKTDGFTLDGREYAYSAVSLEHYDDGQGALHNALAMYMFDPTDTYGSLLSVGPYRAQMQMYPSGSGGNVANVSVQDLKDGRTQALVYGDFVQIGAHHAESIIIGNSTSVVEISGSVRGNFSGSIAATNGVVSGSSQVIGILSSLNTYTGSNDTTNTTQNTRLTALEASASTALSTNNSQDVSVTNLNSFTSSINTTIKSKLNADGVISGSSQVIGILSSLNTYTGSNDTTNTTQNSRLDQLSTASGSAITRLTALEVETANLEAFTSSINTTIKSKLNADGVISGSSQVTLSSTTGFTAYSTSVDSRIATEKGRVDAILLAADADKDSFAEIVTLINSVDLTNDTAFASFYTASVSRLNNLESTSASVNTSISNLNSFSSSENGKSATLATYTGSVEGRFTTLATTTGSLQTSVTNLNSYTASNDTTNTSQNTSITNLNTYTSSFAAASVTLTNKTISGASNTLSNIANSSLTNSSITIAGTSTALGGTITLPTITGGSGIVSGSSQIDATATTNWSTGIKTQLNSNTVISGSSQVTGITNAQLSNSTISGVSLGSSLNALTIGTGLSGASYNGSSAVTIANTGVLSITSNTGLSSNVSATGNVTITNTGVTSNVAGTGISVSGATGAVTITNTGVTSAVAGTGVSVSGATGAVTISIGQAVATSSSPTFAGLTINGAITATGDITAYYSSDKRFKSNIQLIPNALEKVSKLNGVTWTWNEDVNEVTKSTPNTGLIAQEVQEVLPEVVMEREDGHLGLDYSKMVGLLVEAIKEQQTQIHSLTLEIEKLKESKGL